MPDARRHLPSVDQLLKQAEPLIEQWGHEQVTAEVRQLLASRRAVIAQADSNDLDSGSFSANAVIAELETRLRQSNRNSLIPVFNLTGTILHTNLGRAVLPQQAIEAMVSAASTTSNLEFDLETGKRGDRDSHIEPLICELSGAEAATVVNNNAAAVLLVLNSLALNKEVPVSRGELVEIGGSFRIPEVMQRAPCKLVEVGATNRTHLKDYAAAINSDTALLMKVHTSNFSIQGFTKSVTEAELTELAHKHDLPMVIDLGSGNLISMAQFGLPDEPTAAQSLESGADLITFSGDKLLGGPQCGIIAGRKDLIDKIRSNPLKRALRVDKLTIAALTEVLKLYRNPKELLNSLPTVAHLNRSADSIKAQADNLLPQWAAALPKQFSVTVEACESQVGSGALPISTLPSYAIASRATLDSDLVRLQTCARQLPMPVIGRLNDKCFSLDIRCLDDETTFKAQLETLRLSLL